MYSYGNEWTLKDVFNSSADDRIGRIFDRLSQVPEGEEIVAFLKANKVDIQLLENPYNWAASMLTITAIKDGVYEYKDPVIILKEDLSDENLLQAIIHEAEHLYQHLSGVGNPDRVLTEREYILFYRASEAAAQALTTEVAWKLKQAGDDGPWEAAKFVGYHDICDAYEKIATRDPAAIDDGRGRRVAFDAWFDNAQRLASYNKSTVEGMIPALANGRDNIFKDHGLVEKPLDSSWVLKLNNAAGGKSYLFLSGFRDLLFDPHYARDTHTRPADPASDNHMSPPPAMF